MKTASCKWPCGMLGDIIDIFDSIRVPLNSQQREARQGPYPYYGASGIIDAVDAYLFDGEYFLVAEDGENLNSRKLPVAFMACGRFWVNNHAHIIKGKKGVADDRFLIAWFAQADIKGYITGAAQPKLSQANLKRISLQVPPYDSQRKIASILSAYDDLIENNTRRIAILEAMAQALYREWFVEFRFPGHEKAKLVDSQMGKIPEGWIAGMLEDCLVLQRGFDITKSQQTEGPYPVVSSSGPASNHNEFKVRGPGVVIGRKGTLGTVFYIEEDHWPHDTTLWVKEYRQSTPLSAYFLLRSLNLAHFDSGASNPTLNRNHIHTLPVAVPNMAVLQQFDEFVEPLFKQSRVLTRANIRLRQTCDFLLPKLISGQLDVEHLDIDVGEPLVEAEA